MDDLLAHAIVGIGLDVDFDDFNISLVHKMRSHREVVNGVRFFQLKRRLRNLFHLG